MFDKDAVKSPAPVLDPVTGGGQLRRAFGCFPSGVAAICAVIDGAATGMLVSSFTSVSLEPPLVSICIRDKSRTWPRLRTARRIGVSILSDANRALSENVSSDSERFADSELTTTDDGTLLLPGATAWLDCSIYDEVAAGDHFIVLLYIHALHAHPAIPPLVFHNSQYHQLAS